MYGLFDRHTPHAEYQPQHTAPKFRSIDDNHLHTFRSLHII